MTGRPPDYRAAPVEHPLDCSPDLCEVGLTEVWHREIPDQLTPHHDDGVHTPTFTWSLEQIDQIDSVTGARVAGEARARIGLGLESVDWSADELDGVAHALHAMSQRLRRLNGGV
ncbi:hypothetical protein [Actinomycetospora aeridis]|uniref:MerR family transcriptional regulator n=1 Tax=Actinomycetospora aeridis TaxID=3129231 RepID=A0ABU8N143_9PSEU